MKSDYRGCSTCAAGREQWEPYLPYNGKVYIQYDYRTPQGDLFSCIAKDLETARAKMHKWYNEVVLIPCSKMD